MVVPARDHRAGKTPHELMRIAAEVQAEIRDTRFSQRPDPPEALLRFSDNCNRSDELLVENIQMLVGELQEIMLVEARVVPVRVDIVPLHPRAEALDASRKGGRHLTAHRSGVNEIAQQGADCRADGHAGRNRICPLSGREDIDDLEIDNAEALRRKIASRPPGPLREHKARRADVVGRSAERDEPVTELPAMRMTCRPKAAT